MPIPHISTLVDLRDLHLDAALALVDPGEGEWPAGGANSTAEYLQCLIDSLCSLSLRDPLTGLANRRQFRAAVDRELDRVARSGESALLLMLDIDRFKSVNDTHGHVAGDQVLQAVARILTACVRPMDVLARYGGEEFAIVLPGCQSAAFGQVVAERIREAIEAEPVLISNGVSLPITVSVGGAFAMPWIRSNATLWIDRADHELYRAKSLGRNRVCVEDQPDSTVSAEEKSLLFGPTFADIPDVASAPSPDDASASAV